ncbi:MAG TPA: AbrB/MazE/SpoVT family DNA-binding domain-containing protein [Kiritimatiellia bacterium]|nr:AbrB/MazE/SpoVT family DNA-binding domain-containing protein [Kiritimatiellia bacterium]
MTTVTVSTKYQVVIPEKVRKSMGVRPGEKFQVVNYDGRVQLIPLRKMRDMKGLLRGMDTTLVREADRV